MNFRTPIAILLTLVTSACATAPCATRPSAYPASRAPSAMATHRAGPATVMETRPFPPREPLRPPSRPVTPPTPKAPAVPSIPTVPTLRPEAIDGPDAEANRLAREVVAAYRSLRYDEVLEHGNALLARPGAAPRQRADASLFVGAVEYVRGNRGRAEFLFRQAHKLTEDAVLDENLFTEAMAAFIEGCR